MQDREEEGGRAGEDKEAVLVTSSDISNKADDDNN